MPGLEHIDSKDSNALLRAVNEHGACIARNVLPEALCDELVSDFNHHLSSASWGADDIGYQDEFFGNKTKRLHGLFSKSARMVDVLMHPAFMALANSMLVESGVSNDIRLSNAELMALGRGQDNQMFHTDAASWARVQRSESQEILVSANCALTDFTATNGATRVVSGSHRWARDRQPKEDEVCLAVMPKGSALIYTGNAIHSGGANQEDILRIGLYLGYIASWLRPLENQLMTNDPNDLAGLPEAAQRLLDITPGGITVYA